MSYLDFMKMHLSCAGLNILFRTVIFLFHSELLGMAPAWQLDPLNNPSVPLWDVMFACSSGNQHAPEATRNVIHKKQTNKNTPKYKTNGKKKKKKKPTKKSKPTNLTLLTWKTEWVHRWLVGSNLANRNELALPVSYSSMPTTLHLPSNYKLHGPPGLQ